MKVAESNRSIASLIGKTQRVEVTSLDGVWHSQSGRRLHFGSVFDMPAVIDITGSRCVAPAPGKPLKIVDAPPRPSAPNAHMTFNEFMEFISPERLKRDAR